MVTSAIFTETCDNTSKHENDYTRVAEGVDIWFHEWLRRVTTGISGISIILPIYDNNNLCVMTHL